jgi:hypothetical protein
VVRPPPNLNHNNRLTGPLYRGYFNDVLRTVDRSKPGHKVLSDINDPEGTRGLAEAIFRSGRRDGTRVLQEAVNAAGHRPPIEAKGFMGPATIAAYKRMLSDPATRDIMLNTLADGLTAYALEEHQSDESDRYDLLRPAPSP